MYILHSMNESKILDMIRTCLRFACLKVGEHMILHSSLIFLQLMADNNVVFSLCLLHVLILHFSDKELWVSISITLLQRDLHLLFVLGHLHLVSRRSKLEELKWVSACAMLDYIVIQIDMV